VSKGRRLFHATIQSRVHLTGVLRAGGVRNESDMGENG
jgi:hypothetical protein